MSKYTTEVRFLCENLAGLEESKGYSSVTSILNSSWSKIFDFDFPVYDEEYKPVLCKKILKHYYTREIGEETVGLWKLRLDARMNEIMPYYNKLYESALIEFDPMHDTDLHREYNKEGEDVKRGNTTDNETGSGTSNDQRNIDKAGQSTDTFNDTHTIHSVTDQDGTSHDDNAQWNVFSDTPQGALTRVDENTYLTDARKITEDNTGRTTNDVVVDSTDAHTGTVGTAYGEEIEDVDVKSYSDTTQRTGTYTENLNTTDEYLEHLYGKSSGVSFSKLLQEYRETLLNIDVMIINELQDLFMNIW